MKYAPAVVLGAAAIIVGITTGLNQASNAHASLHSYLIGYGVAVVLVVLALVLAFVASSQERPKPRVVPVRYGRDKSEGRYGLIIVNEAESAYDVSILEKRVPIGSAQLVFEHEVPRLTKESGEALIEAWIEVPSRVNLTGDDLFHQMVKSKVPSITVQIAYKDGDNRRYVSVCKIERDVVAPGGLTTRFVRQRRTGLPRFLRPRN